MKIAIVSALVVVSMLCCCSSPEPQTNATPVAVEVAPDTVVVPSVPTYSFKNDSVILMPKTFNEGRIENLEIEKEVDGKEYKVHYIITLSKDFEPSGDISPYDEVTSGHIDSFVVEDGNAYYKSVDGVLFSSDMQKLVMYPNGRTDSSYQVPDGTTIIGMSAFANSTLSSISLPNTLEFIDEVAFANCSNLKSFALPASVLEIGNNAFDLCYEDCIDDYNYYKSVATVAQDIQIPADSKLSRLGNRALPFAKKVFISKFLTQNIRKAIGNPIVTVDKDNPVYSSQDGVLYNKKKTELIMFPSCKGGTFKCPGSVVKVDSFAFDDNRDLIKIVFNKGLRVIQDNAFTNCQSLTEVELPATLVELNGNVWNVRPEFTNNLEKVTVDKNSPLFCSINGVLFSKDKKRIIVYPQGKGGDTYIVPEGVETIGARAFWGCNLKKVVLPKSLREIEKEAFSECLFMKRIDIPAAVEFIGVDCFYKYFEQDSLVNVYFHSAEAPTFEESEMGSARFFVPKKSMDSYKEMIDPSYEIKGY